MPHFDLPLDELRRYNPPVAPPADFDEFWHTTLTTPAPSPPAAPRFERVTDEAYGLVDVWDVTFAGYAQDPIRGWLLTPAERPGGAPAGRLPCVVSYVGYGGGRGLPLDHLAVPVAGLAHFVMDTRGQGAGWSPGATADPAGRGPHAPGFMTAGIESREAYYYRRVFVDAVRAVEAAAAHPRVDPDRIAVAGASQGGGIALAAAGLLGERVKLLLADVPFLCHFRRATTLVDTQPYAEIVQYLRIHREAAERVYATLAYFDGVHFAARVRAAALFSVGLMDQVCPPSTVFAAYNRLPGDKQIRVYDFNQHEGGGSAHVLERLRFLRARL